MNLKRGGKCGRREENGAEGLRQDWRCFNGRSDTTAILVCTCCCLRNCIFDVALSSHMSDYFNGRSDTTAILVCTCCRLRNCIFDVALSSHMSDYFNGRSDTTAILVCTCCRLRNCIFDVALSQMSDYFYFSSGRIAAEMLTPRFRVWRCNSPMSAGPLYSVPTFTHPTLARRTPCLKSSHLVDLVGSSGQPAAVAGRGTNGIGWHPAQAAQEEPQADLQACTQRLQCVVVRVPSVVPAAPTTTSSARLQLNDEFLQPLLSGRPHSGQRWLFLATSQPVGFAGAPLKTNFFVQQSLGEGESRFSGLGGVRQDKTLLKMSEIICRRSSCHSCHLSQRRGPTAAGLLLPPAHSFLITALTEQLQGRLDVGRACGTIIVRYAHSVCSVPNIRNACNA